MSAWLGAMVHACPVPWSTLAWPCWKYTAAAIPHAHDKRGHGTRRCPLKSEISPLKSPHRPLNSTKNHAKKGDVNNIPLFASLGANKGRLGPVLLGAV